MGSESKKTNSNQLIVLKKCGFLMKNLGLYAENKCHTFESKIKFTVPVWIIQLIYSIPMCTCVLLAFWHIIDNNLDLTASSVAVIVIVGGGHCQVIYFLLIANNTALINVIDQLQKLVNKRKSQWFFTQIF